jgi:hypothetical protein
MFAHNFVQKGEELFPVLVMEVLEEDDEKLK